jgi:hypothetical protein
VAGLARQLENSTGQRENQEPVSETNLWTRKEAIMLLRLSPSHFSKVVNGKVKGLPTLPVIHIGRRQLFQRASLDQWIKEVEAQGRRLAMSS